MRSRTFSASWMFCLYASSSAACGDDTTVPPYRTPDASLASDDDSGAQAGAVSYARDVSPIFARCVICHYADSVIGYDLTHPFDATHGIVGRKNDWFTEGHASKNEYVVKPGSPDESFLIYKVAADPDPKTFDYENNG